MDWAIPRQSLPDRVAERVRAWIRSGVLGAQFPGEHTLAARLHVSRRTLRAALQTLERDGTLRTTQGRRRVVADAMGKQPADAGGVVGLLVPEDAEQVSAVVRRQIHHVAESLAEEGFRLETVSGPFHRMRQPGRLLESVVSRTGAAAWILHRSSPAMQAWFADQGIPCVVDGTPDAEVGLPGVDLDWRAIGFHVAGELGRLGHRVVAVLEPERRSVGLDRLNVGLAQGGVHGIELRHGRHASGEASAVARLVHRLFSTGPRPSVLVVHAFSDLTPAWLTLLDLGLRIPRDVSVITTDDDPGVYRFLPAVAHYRRNPALHAAKLRLRVLHALRQGTLRAEPLLLDAEYVPGGSVTAIPGASSLMP